VSSASFSKCSMKILLTTGDSYFPIAITSFCTCRPCCMLENKWFLNIPRTTPWRHPPPNRTFSQFIICPQFVTISRISLTGRLVRRLTTSKLFSLSDSWTFKDLSSCRNCSEFFFFT
jgi:hypothetical protein